LEKRKLKHKNRRAGKFGKTLEEQVWKRIFWIGKFLAQSETVLDHVRVSSYPAQIYHVV